MIENRMVNDRCWPAPKPMTREELADELLRDNLYRVWDWHNEETESNVRDMLSHVIYTAFRDPSLKNDEERMIEIRRYLTGFCEAWADNKAEESE